MLMYATFVLLGNDGDSAILDPSIDTSTLVSSCDTAPSNGPLFAIDTNSGDLYIESKRIELIENTLDDPAMSSTQPLCTSAAKTFLNEHSCVPNLDACITQSFSSADVVLNNDSLRTFYTLSQKYVYVIKGLQLVEDTQNPMDPCSKFLLFSVPIILTSNSHFSVSNPNQMASDLDGLKIHKRLNLDVMDGILNPRPTHKCYNLLLVPRLKLTVAMVTFTIFN